MRGDNAAKIYTAEIEGEEKFLHADAHAAAIQIGTEHRWPLRDPPMLQ